MRPIRGRGRTEGAIRPVPIVLLLLFMAVVDLVAVPPKVFAQGRSYEIEEFHATIRVQENGRLAVLERIRFRFDGSFNGIYRRIPVSYQGPAGLNYRLHLDVDGVFDESGSELRWEESREGRYRRLQVWIPDAVDASRAIAIRYGVIGGLRFFDEGDAEGFAAAHDELYWNVTGTEWEVPIGSASARVELPEEVDGRRATAYTGPWGSRATGAEITEIEEGFQFNSDRELGPGEGLTLVVGWNAGVVERPGLLTRAGILLAANWVLLVPILVTLGMWWLWYTRGRDPALRSIAPWYEPPEGLTPAETGTLMDDRPDTRDVVSTLVDLAVRGYVRIEEIDKGAIQEFFTGADYRFYRVRDADSWEDLHDHEQEVLRGLFGGSGVSASVQLSDLKNDFYRHLDDIKNGIFRRLMDLGFYQQRPDKVRRIYLAIGGGLIAVSTFLVVVLDSVLNVSFVALLIAVTGTAAAVMGFGYFMPARTRKGSRKLEEVRGFQEFLDRVEEDRFKRMITSPDQFEAYLPYAMALGVESTWARAFEDIVTESPDWYVGHSPGRFHAPTFAQSLDQMSARSGSVLASSPRSSSGSSGFSGGSSGGGFGGGGGGAF
ncbi:MAG: DUF2207 domain-containing protein [Longimicrobiales bacterium]|nr:DUF2207 domain-containing protein [Longimicrobiales bacterium]